MQHADFRVGGKIFAGLTPDGQRATVKMTLEAQSAVTGDVAFTPCAGAWGRAGWTSIDLANVKAGALPELLAEAAQLVLPKKRSAPKRASDVLSKGLLSSTKAAKPGRKKPAR